MVQSTFTQERSHFSRFSFRSYKPTCFRCTRLCFTITILMTIIGKYCTGVVGTDHHHQHNGHHHPHHHHHHHHNHHNLHQQQRLTDQLNRIKRITDSDMETFPYKNFTSKPAKLDESAIMYKPSKFDDNVHDTVHVDMLENGTQVEDTSDDIGRGTILMTKDQPDPETDNFSGSTSNLVRTQRKSVTPASRSKTTSHHKSSDVSKTKWKESRVKSDNSTILEGPHLRRSRRSYVRFPPGESLPVQQPRSFYSQAQRRFVRFPPNSDFPTGPFRPSRPLVPPHPGHWVPPTAPFHPGFQPPVPSMGPRSPRLVFKDPVEPGTIQASLFNQNGFQDLTAPEENRGIADIWSEASDSKTKCSSGSCEFFLSCWMTSGLIEGTCGGLLYACCHRNTAKTSEHHGPLVTNDIPVPANYGPVVNDPRCGVSVAKQGAQRRIVGGDEAGFGSFPWQAYIRIGSSRCGGSLVNRYHVVTAGHCVARASARQVQVTLGDYVINSAVEPLPAYTFGVRKISVHPYFKFTPQADRFDVAVLRLDRPVQYMAHIAPICLPEKGEDFLGQFGWAAGWGALQAGSRLRPKTLQAVDVPVIDNRLCERWHKSNGINVIIYDEMMCAGYRGGGKDSCQGDSGGPLMMERTGRWYLIGIVSAGYSCAQRGQPGIYHRVAHTVDWISYIINS
ncbi:uncharacterized protein LOC111043398 isoform X1 [Nilaparvata lugens]|uniref:uncharacterized protein LOC111043398 isoform X1 n=1 Tax=Nilaparvata lugens TaxID=108931 RepID=UPI000B98C2C2|nr:uncharacterized protein LOC111043398 isoform X1 [Nilaparvata lugens]